MHYLANIDKEVAGTLQTDSFLYGTFIPFCTQFVYLFFMLSSFSMCCGYCNKFAVIDGKSGFDTEKFYSKRYCRIWSFALLICIDVLLNPTVEELYEACADLTLAFNLLPNSDIKVIGG